ncbi:MAG: hypothetical protein JST23_13045, partial [Bacteroidetes bacterium]|nr:hypothetical protein [Bacteroidota bacterium]
MVLLLMKNCICLLLIYLLGVNLINAQSGCVDSSTHFTYSVQANNSLHIIKIFACKDGGKIYQGRFTKNNDMSYLEKNILIKFNNRGEIQWSKKISFLGTDYGIDRIVQTSNGNIVLLSGEHIALNGNMPYQYAVLSENGNLIYQNIIGFSNVSNLYQRSTHDCLLVPYGTDSLLIGLRASGEPTDAGERFFLGTMSNDGQLGNFVSYIFFFENLYSFCFNNAKITGNIIELYGSAYFFNSCINPYNYHEQPVLPYLKIDMVTKQILDKKVYCMPSLGSNWGYFNSQSDLGYENHAFHSYFPQANGNTIVTSTYMGLEFIGTDTINKLFYITEFDKNFNPIKSEYITAKNRFKRDCVYSIYIDSFNTRHIQIHDKPNNELYYAVGDANNNYFLQKKIPFLSDQQNKIFTRQSFLEKGSFTSFNVISKTANHNKIDDFRILARDTSANCFGINTEFLNSKPTSVSQLNFQGNFIIENLSIVNDPINYTLEDYPMQTNIVCKIINKCDTIKINAPSVVCDISQPVLITA